MTVRRMFEDLWGDECGAVLSAELVTVGTVLVVGLVAGFGYLQAALVEEYTDLAGAVTSLNQSYATSGFQGFRQRCSSWTAGSNFVDRQAARGLDQVCPDVAGWTHASRPYDGPLIHSLHSTDGCNHVLDCDKHGCHGHAKSDDDEKKEQKDDPAIPPEPNDA